VSTSDWTTLRVPDGDELTYAERVGDCDHVVGASDEREGFGSPRRPAVTAKVGCEHAKVRAERLERREPVQRGACPESVEQHEDRNPG
jgi:hypothetical protein